MLKTISLETGTVQVNQEEQLKRGNSHACDLENLFSVEIINFLFETTISNTLDTDKSKNLTKLQKTSSISI